MEKMVQLSLFWIKLDPKKIKWAVEFIFTFLDLIW